MDRQAAIALGIMVAAIGGCIGSGFILGSWECESGCAVYSDACAARFPNCVCERSDGSRYILDQRREPE